MKHRFFLMAGLFAFLFFNQTAMTHAAYSQTTQTAQAQTVEPASDFKKAHESFIKKDFKASAAEIRNGADFLKKEAESAGNEGKEMLTASAAELDELADKVEKGAVKSDKEMKAAFSRAEQAAAKNDYVKATDSWTQKKARETGEAIKTAAYHMEQAADWSGHKLKSGASRAIKKGRELSGKLIKGAGYVPEEVGKGLKNMGDAISGFGKKLLPDKK